jgi:hypothetical protein
MKIISRSLVTTLVLLCFRLLQTVEAVVPPPDGGYPNFTTAEGQNCLFQPDQLNKSVQLAENRQ